MGKTTAVATQAEIMSWRRSRWVRAHQGAKGYRDVTALVDENRPWVDRQMVFEGQPEREPKNAHVDREFVERYPGNDNHE